jgi:Heterokaryon incompatibility protein (HET)
MRQHRFIPFSQKGYAIRVLQLLPSTDESKPLRCKLLEYLFEHVDTTNHVYEALSYVWGGEQKPKSIIITEVQNDEHQEVDSELAVTQSLHAALSHLRHRQFPRFLWVDAICIDQVNDEEKEHQIQLMPVIYARARCVLVWLGEAQDDSDMVLESIRFASEGAAEQELKTASRFLQHPRDRTQTLKRKKLQPTEATLSRVSKRKVTDLHDFRVDKSTHKRQASPRRANSSIQCDINVDHLRQAIQKLLNRPWFRRMWV